MWSPSSSSKLAVLDLNSTRPGRRRRRRFRLDFQLERLEDRQLLSGPAVQVSGATASFIGQDTTTEGSWIGAYGSQGYDVIGNTASLPSYATVTPAGQQSCTWAASTTDLRALQNASGSGHIAACWYSFSGFTVDVNLTDGQTHDLQLYFLDWDTTTRGESVQFSNAATGAVLNTETVASFHSGVYLDWAVSGNVDITITHQAGANAVLSGLFFGTPTTPTTPTATFIEQDTATQGTWIGTYGSQGYDVIGNAASLPSYATVTPTGQQSATWAASTTDPRALQNGSGSGRIAACWYSFSSFTVDVNLTDGQTHDLELYFLDWDSTTRGESVQISNASTGAVLNTETVTSFHSGVYLDWAVSGNVDITITHQAGANAVLSGLFLDPPTIAAPTASLSGPSSGAVGTSLSYTASATDVDPAVQAAGFAYAWNFGDGSTGSGATASHSFASAGTYTVSVSATDEYGKVGTSSGTITIFSPPSVNAGPALTVSAESSLAFSQATESGGTAPFAYTWNFGDGTNQTGSLNPSHTYANPGSYTATLSVTDANNLTSSSSVVVTVNDVPPTVTFTDPPAVAGSPVSFTASANDVSPAVQAAGFTYAWNFGDGGTGSGATASHTYTSAGTYTVTVTATDEYGNSGTTSGPIVISNSTATATTYTLTTPNPATGSLGTASGAFTVALPTGQTVASPVTVTLSDGGAGGTFTPAQVTLSNANPTATFTYTPATAGAITITSTNSGGLTNPGPVLYLDNNPALTTELFEFGPKSTPTDPGYTRVGASAGYSAALGYGWTQGANIQERDQGVGSNLDRAFCAVNPGDFMTFRVNVPDGYYSVTLTSGNAYYAFSDEAIYLQNTQVDTLTASGGQYLTRTYNVIVSAGDLLVGASMPGGGALNGLVINEVAGAPTVSAGLNITGNEGSPVAFEGLAVGANPLTYQWNFGDGTTASGSLNPTHTYMPNGVYTATLTVTDTYGQITQSSLTATVNIVPPTVSVTAPATGFTGTSIAVSALATDVNPVGEAAGFTYLWNFGDGTTATGSSATHTYALDALYTVTVSATDEFGEVGTASAQVNVFRAGFPGNTTATYYNLTPPNSPISGVGIPSGSFTVGLPNDRFVSSPVTVTPNDGGAGGTFTPSSVVLSDANPTATFTYTAAQAGTITIATTDNGGLNNPPSATFTAQNLVTTYTLSGPSSGTVATAATFTLTLGTGWLTNPVQLTPSASNGDGTFSPSSITLTNTSRSATFTYTPTLYDARNIVTTNNGNLSDPAPLAFLSEVQTGSSGTAPSGNQAPDLGGFDFFANGAWWQALGSPASDYGVAPNSASYISGFGGLNVRVDWSTTTANGGNSIYGMPINVVPGTQALLPLTLGAYASESDPGPSPYYAGMSIENWQSASGVPPTLDQASDGNDHHGLVMVRNETTGGIAYLYEGYDLYSNDGGDTWGVTGSQAIFNLNTGAPRPEFYTSTDAAGLPISPLLVNYSEAELAATGGPAIDHPFRVCISAGLSLNAFVWPARHGAYAGSTTSGLPMGSRLQLTQAWYNANINSFDPVDRAVVTAMYQYGVIVADLTDGGGLWLEGINDQRWTTSELSALGSIPDSAFQVLNTIQSPVSFTGPTSGQVGVPQTYNLQYLIGGDSNFATSLYIGVTGPPGVNVGNALSSTWFALGDQPGCSLGPFSLTFTPPVAGTYVLSINYGGNDWILPANITFTASNAQPSVVVDVGVPSATVQTSSLAIMALPADGGAAADPAPASISVALKPIAGSSQVAHAPKAPSATQNQVAASPFSSPLGVQPRNLLVRSARVQLLRTLPKLVGSIADDSVQS